jgi:aminoglycoside phosphotransferase (APT) family kinase protein
VARARCLCEDPSVIGTAFYVMDYVDGRVHWDAALPEASREARAAVYAETNRVIAALHRLDHVRLGLDDYGKPGSYFERQVSRWTKQYRASETERIEAMDRLIEWLPAHVPARDATSVVHGDYRLDNMIFHPSEPRVLAVLDWELSTIGHPLADFAYHCMIFHIPREYGGLLGHDLEALGIPSEQAYLAEYCRRLDLETIPEGEWRFYLAFSLFRVAAISQGILKRALTGTAASRHALEYGRRARTYAELGWDQIQRLGTP